MTRNAAAGVFQGALLSPALFSIYVADLPISPGVEVALFADDMLLMATCRAEKLVLIRLQRYMDGLQEWTNRWRIKINAEKGSDVLFSRLKINSLCRIIADEVLWDNPES